MTATLPTPRDRVLAWTSVVLAAVAALIPGAKAVPARLPATTIEVVVGADFRGVKATGIPRQQNEHRAGDDPCGSAGS
ncbi:hypothetical protein [Spirillospora sp. NPDC047279]|uniref:hypothetical protein n=1 Tax=Spirillospora sp. NPDC047279 TaxID=3155478 RepID=UPI00340CC44F